jgi:hypothetical protein
MAHHYLTDGIDLGAVWEQDWRCGDLRRIHAQIILAIASNPEDGGETSMGWVTISSGRSS